MTATTEKTAPAQIEPKKDTVPKYSVALTEELNKDLSYVAGRLDISKARVFKDAVAFYRKAVEAGTIK